MVQEPQTERGRRSRERIVEAAAATIRERGVEGAGIDHILAAAGASKSQLYHYFDSKDDLVRAVIACTFARSVDDQRPWLENLDSFAAIRRWFDMMIAQNEAHGAPGCPLGALASELAGRDEQARVDLAGCFGAWIGYLVEGLGKMQARGDLDPEADPRRLANAVFAGIQGGLLLAKTAKDVTPLRDALDASYGYLRSLRPSP